MEFIILGIIIYISFKLSFFSIYSNKYPTIKIKYSIFNKKGFKNDEKNHRKR